MRIENNFKGHLIGKPPKVNNANISLEAEFLYLSYLGLEVKSSALVGLNAFWLGLNFPMKDQVSCSGHFIGKFV